MRRGRQAASIGIISATLTGGLLLHSTDATATRTASTPVAEACTVAPLVSPIWDGIEIPQSTAPVSIAGPFVPPSGVAVDGATLDGVTSTITESIACQNAGDVFRTLALFTPEAVRGFFSGPRGFDADSVEATAEAGAVPVSEDRVVELISIENVVQLDDGGVGATVTTAVSDVEYVDSVILVEGSAPDGTARWLINGSIAIDSQTQVEGGAIEIP